MIIHINSHIIKSNSKESDPSKFKPPISIRKTRCGKVIERKFSMDIEFPCKIVYSPDKPLPCGAKVWIETK